MKIRWIVGVCAAITFIIPLVQLSIGFKFVVDDGTNADQVCSAATDLPLIMAIGGIFILFYLGTLYGVLYMVASDDKTESDISGSGPKILIGLVSFIFGAITLIFFILMQMRVYRAYSNNVQFSNQLGPNYCKPAVMRGGLAMVILEYINILIVIAIYILILFKARKKRQEKERELPTS